MRSFVIASRWDFRRKTRDNRRFYVVFSAKTLEEGRGHTCMASVPVYSKAYFLLDINRYIRSRKKECSRS